MSFPIESLHGIRACLFQTMSKDKDESSASTDMEEEAYVKRRAVKKDAYYVASSNGSRLIIPQVQLKENLKDNIIPNAPKPCTCFEIKEKIGIHRRFNPNSGR